MKNEVNTALSQANRDSGNWLPNVKKCPKRMIPCGNASCADEVMRGAQVSVEGIGIRVQNECFSHAKKIAADCEEQGYVCPLSELFNTTPTEAVDSFIDLQMISTGKRV